MADSSVPTSVRLQKKMLANRYADKNDGDFLVVWFPEEEAYSIVDRKSVLESKANVRDKVTVKDSKGKWKCRVVFKGSGESCQKQQIKLESILEGDDGDSEEKESPEGSKSEKRLCKIDEECLEDITEDSEQVQEEKERVATFLKRMKKVIKTESATETVIKSPEQAEGSKLKKRLCKTDEKYLEDITEDSKQMQTEKERVATLLKKMKKVSKTESATETVTKPYLGSVHFEYDQPVGAVLKELFDGVYSRLDGMNSLLQQQTKSLAAIMVPKQTSSATNGLSGYQRSTAPATHTVTVGLPATPLLTDSGNVGDLPAKTPVKAGPADPASPLQVNHEAFVVNGINLLTDVPAKARKPKLYATSLLSVLFTDKEMRNGSVEPKEGTTTKVALNSTKINLIKKCIMVKFGEKVVEKSWAEIRTSLNQKCLDKLKAFRKLNMTLTHAAQTNGAQSETDEAQTLDDHEDMDV